MEPLELQMTEELILEILKLEIAGRVNEYAEPDELAEDVLAWFGLPTEYRGPAYEMAEVAIEESRQEDYFQGYQ